MSRNVIRVENLSAYSGDVGNKTLTLKQCMDWGFRVPAFIALPSFLAEKLLADEDLRKTVAEEIHALLKSKTYAVRSSALIEDGKTQSLAGQFLTKTNVENAGLARALFEVLKHAQECLKGDLQKFSIIVQEYIIPDISGVTFTRNPNGNREMVIEYGFCEGKKIVSGQVKPERIVTYWDTPVGRHSRKLSPILEAIPTFTEIEKKYHFPQDIEWCIRDDVLFLVQTRPITTILENQYKQILFLDDALPKNTHFFFEKTEISEIAPRPTSITHDLFRLIYSDTGPVRAVYKKHGVKYRDTGFLIIFGNELFVDKEKEIQGILPSYTYFSTDRFVPRFRRFSRAALTAQNLLALNSISTKNVGDLFQNVKRKIEAEWKKMDVKTACANFLADYELIFEVNLLSGIALKKFNALLKNEPVHFSEIITARSQFLDLKKHAVQPPDHVQGNALEISDESPFVSNEKEREKKNKNVQEWWQRLPKRKKQFFEKKIVEAILHHRLRELGRWLTVKHISSIRSCLMAYAKKSAFHDSKNIYFAHFKDIFDGTADEADCQKRKTKYGEYNAFQLPTIVTSSVIKSVFQTMGVSSGSATGVLLDAKSIDNISSKHGTVIVYTEILSPDLTQYFGKIGGIVSHNGGILSHLAIIAREKHIPVVVHFSLAESDIHIGDTIRIDGDAGEIEKVTSERIDE